MKKKFASFTIAALITFSAAFASPKTDVAPEKIQQEFRKEFVRATNITWEIKTGFYKATFSVDGQQLQAFYSLSNEFMGISRNIVFNQLPLLLQKDLKETYAAYWISNLFETVTKQGTAYYITFENGNRQVTLQAGATNWSVYSKTDKS